MTDVQVSIPMSHGRLPVVVGGWDVGVPGLAVTPDLGYEEVPEPSLFAFVVTHIESGYQVCGSFDFEMASRIAWALRDVTDWTATKEEIVAAEWIGHKVREVVASVTSSTTDGEK